MAATAHSPWPCAGARRPAPWHQNSALQAKIEHARLSAATPAAVTQDARPQPWLALNDEGDASDSHAAWLENLPGQLQQVEQQQQQSDRLPHLQRVAFQQRLMLMAGQQLGVGVVKVGQQLTERRGA